MIEKNRQIFLATTALEEFWDTTKPILFLGDWCLRYSRRSFWKQINGELMKSPFETPEAAGAAYNYVSGIYEQLLLLLGETLNSIHGTNYSVRYWRILLGPWLQDYLSVVYDRYRHLKYALELYPNCTTIVLSEESFIVPADTLDFEYRLRDDSFNLQIYTKILFFLGKTFPCKKLQTLQNPLYAKTQCSSWKSRIMNYIFKMYTVISAKLFRAVVLRNSYFPRTAEIQLMLKMPCKVLPIWGPFSKQPLIQYSSNSRKKLRRIWIGDGEFERCLAAMLFSDVPKSFVEGFIAYSSAAKKIYPKKIKAIFSANSWHMDESFKFWAAASAEKGVILLGTQHGGNYGALANLTAEKHETEIVDYYYSWGWGKTDCRAKVIPLSSPKLVGRKKIGASKLKSGVLWGTTTSSSRYLTQFPFLPKYFHEYLFWQTRFAKTLRPEILSEVRLRSHYDDQGWDIAQRLTEFIPDAQIETWAVSFLDSLCNCRLYVCDHLSTTYAEALVADKPTILFWDPKYNKLKSEAQPYFDLLRKNGILFDTPEGAGVAVNNVYHDVETWWNDPERQAAVVSFCERFARTSPQAIELWVNEFKRVANSEV